MVPFPNIPNLPGGYPWPGNVPGIGGIGRNDVVDQQHPDYSGPPQPPAPPSCWPPATADDYARAAIRNLGMMLGDRYARQILQEFVGDTFGRRWVPASPPPWIAPSPAALPMSTVVTGAVSGAAGAFATLASVQVPSGMFGRIALFGHDTQNDAAGVGGTDWASLTWSFLVGPSLTNLRPVSGYGAFTAQIGQVEAPVPLWIFVPEGNFFVVQAASVAAAISNLSVVIHGWQWEINNPGTQHVGADHIAGIMR